MKGGLSLVHKLGIVLCITLAWGILGQGSASAQTDAVSVSLLAPQPAQLQVNAAGDGIEIRTIQVVGLQHLPESEVLTALTIKPGDILVGNATAKLSDAEDALYNSGWFRSKPVLSLDIEGVGARLNVEVYENPLYLGTRITGNERISTERLLQEVEGTVAADGTRTGARMLPGQVINIKRLVSALDGMLAVYQDQGYIAANISDYSFMVAGPEEGTVEIEISEGLVDDVIVVGVERTRESVVYSQITHVREDQVLMRSDLERDLNQIYNTGLFDSVTPNLEPSLKEGYTKVVINVEEAATGQAGVGLGYSTVNGLQGTLSYNEKNLFGTGKQLGAVLLFSNNKPGFELSYSDPYYTDDSFWNVGIFNVHSRQQRSPGQPYESELVVNTVGGQVGYGQHLSDEDTWQVSMAITDYDYKIRKGDPFIGYSPAGRARLSASGETRKLGATYSHDTRDNIFSTTQGYLGKVTTEFAGFGGDFNFSKYTLEGREFYEFGPGTLGFRQRLGFANGTVPIYEEYRLGGVNSLRGLSEDLITGTHSFLGNAEYRHPLNDTFGLVGFFDVGFAGESFSDMDSASGAGIGARIKLKALGIGAVRLDYGWELSGETGNNSRFHFFLGEMF
jgi:outer membrane protein insertion porin family